MKVAALVLLAACSDDTLVVAPIIDSPANASAQPFPNLDAVVLAVAHAGQDTDVVSQTFPRGSALSLAGVPYAQDLVIHMSGLVGAGEVAYGRTCTFAFSATGTPPAPHLYFSRIVKFGDLGVMTRVRNDGSGVAAGALGLFVGGVDGAGGSVVEVEQFDPATGTMMDVATLEPRSGAEVALIGVAPPRIALIGGARADGTAAGFVEIVAPSAATTARVDRLDDTQLGRSGFTATTLGDGRVIVIGGAAPGLAPSAEVDEIVATSGSAEARQLRAMLAFPRRGHTATVLGDDVGADVVVLGGLDAAGKPVGAAELFKPLSQTFAPQAPAMLVPRSQHRAVLLTDNSILVIGGLDATGAPVRRLERFDVDTGFVDAGTLPDGAGALDFSATKLPDGRVLIAGGRATPGGPTLDTAFIAQLDSINGTIAIVATDRLSIPRAQHQAMLLCDGTVLLGGGTAQPAVAERYDPPALGRR